MKVKLIFPNLFAIIGYTYLYALNVSLCTTTHNFRGTVPITAVIFAEHHRRS